jgi:predicted amidohydrolase
LVRFRLLVDVLGGLHHRYERVVILKATAIPARVLSRAQQIGTLAPAAQADILVFDLESGDFSFTDTHLKVRHGNRRIVPHLVIKEGEVYSPGSIPIKLRDLYESDMEVFRALG